MGMQMKTLIIGGGPSGMLAAISASTIGDDVTIIEKNNSLGKKLLITGKGRCNITSSLSMMDFIDNIPGNGRFLYSAFQNFTNQDTIDLLNKNGLQVKKERGNRIFPVTDKAQSVLDSLKKEIQKHSNINILYDTKALEVLKKEDRVIGVKIQNHNETKTINADKVIIATGGASYSTTGSTGDGYKMAEKLGHTIVPIKPSIVPLKADVKICKELQGLSLKNIAIKVLDNSSNKIIYTDFGEMLFTHFGVSGPIILSGSAHLVRYKNIDELFNNKKIVLNIDLKPALTQEQLDARILRDFEQEKNKEFKNSLDNLLPQKMIPYIISISKIEPTKKVNSITKEERLRLVQLIKKLEVTIEGFRSIEEAVITAGGVSIKEINPATMESKIVKGLYFAGEVIDVDAYTGGFNLQIAYSTGYTAGKSN
jgi:hypothetical protein